MSIEIWQAALIFFAGWSAGVVGEYTFHWVMHRYSLRFHINHHKEFFVLPGRQVAVNDLDVRMNVKFFLLFLLLLSPLMYFWGWLPVLLFWCGAFWHLVIVYEGCHAVMHYEQWLPAFVRRSRLFQWWKGCHFEHHRSSPTGNYCVTFPVLDFFFGTYVHPRQIAETARTEQSQTP
ncbi:MAG TPA: sterol desaturase family protein [Planctomycetota bacterium]|nr:sterol desaturase family protein [Planctomycetota bacterium]